MRTEFPIYSQFQASAGQLDISCINVKKAGDKRENDLEDCRLRAISNALAALEFESQTSIAKEERFVELVSENPISLDKIPAKGLRLSLKSVREMARTTFKSFSSYMTF